MDTVLLAAHTPPGSNPPYYNATLHRAGPMKGRVAITVRSTPAAKDASAPTSCIVMSVDTFRALATEAIKVLDAQPEQRWPNCGGDDFHEGDAGC